MNSRRSFLKSIFLGSAALYLPKAADAFIWKAPRAASAVWSGRQIINPSWVNAPYEIAFLLGENQIIPMYVKRNPFEKINIPENVKRVIESYPIRFNAETCAPIPPFIEA